MEKATIRENWLSVRRGGKGGGKRGTTRRTRTTTTTTTTRTRKLISSVYNTLINCN